MAKPSRKLSVETLETRQLLSSIMDAHPGTESRAAKPHTVSVNGSLSGIEGFTHGSSSNPSFNNATEYLDGSGTLPVLGAVQMTASIPPSPTSTERGTLTLAASEGTLDFNLVSSPHGHTKLTLTGGTGAYRGYNGSGTLLVNITNPGYRHQFDVISTFKLKLKT
jgi:hypothetical protein